MLFRSGRQVVVAGPRGVVEVAADEARGDGLHPLGVVEEAEVVLHLDVAEVVPVADVRDVEFIEHLDHFALVGQLLEAELHPRQSLRKQHQNPVAIDLKIYLFQAFDCIL